MTSSSDNEFQRRRIFVHGVAPRCAGPALAAFFSSFGAVVSAHNSKHGYAFVTFEEEEAAVKALGANGETFQGKVLSVRRTLINAVNRRVWGIINTSSFQVEFSHSARQAPHSVTYGGGGGGGGRRSVQHFPKTFAASASSYGAAGAIAEGGASSAHHFFRPNYFHRHQQYQQQQQQQQPYHFGSGSYHQPPPPHHHYHGPGRGGGGRGGGGRGGSHHHHHHSHSHHHRLRHHHHLQQQRSDRRGQIFPHHVRVVHSPEYLLSLREEEKSRLSSPPDVGDGEEELKVGTNFKQRERETSCTLFYLCIHSVSGIKTHPSQSNCSFLPLTPRSPTASCSRSSPTRTSPRPSSARWTPPP